MQLQELWKKYSPFNRFDLSILPDTIIAQGTRVSYLPQSVIMKQGDFPQYIYFIESGSVFGSREYHDGNNYCYFHINKDNGSVGLLEILAQEPQTIATVIAGTRVTALRLSSAVIYEYLMTHTETLFNCIYILAHDLYQRSGNDGILYYQRGIDRVRYFLVYYYSLQKKPGRALPDIPDYETIASNIGVSVRTVVRSIQRLKDHGEISTVRKKIYITPEQFQQMKEKIAPFLHS